MSDILLLLTKSSDAIIIFVAFLSALFAIIGAFRSGVLRHVKFGSFELQASEKDTQEARAIIQAVALSPEERVPFETEQLANYYAQVLAQSKISFWFSLVFASIGFFIIVLAAFMHAGADSGSTIARFIAGGVVDAVAALFFIQSKRAQESMAEFFDKLRRDRNHVEARRLCESLEIPAARDALRIRLSLHYAEVNTADAISDSIISACLKNEKRSEIEN